MSENVREIIKRLYGYLNRFKEIDRLEIDVFYVMSNIIYGNTFKSNQKYLRELINE